MKTLLSFLFLLCVALPAFAQPQGREDALREQRAWEREQRMQRWDERRDNSRARRESFCREWRERVARHPRMLLPEVCRRWG